ncbi:uncharacterized protein LOC119740764 [Patiria miniata]|uniref:Uncharacterized protein n=1 Tax=Patiria miniata TaxID=46514 RepID=A0A914B7G0_PATMI|nr:uncharacterized protein LOC119740764 [Patiria miniata]
MSAVCGRCREEEAVLECADCVGSKHRGELIPLCDACTALIHVGFLSDHQVISVTIKQQKIQFEELLKNFKSHGKHLQLKLNEVHYARQDIEQRSQYNHQVVTHAFQAVWQTLKQKEKEVTAPLKESSKKEAALLAECEKSVGQATSEFKNLCTEAQKLLQGNSLDFARQYDGMKQKLEEFKIDGVGNSFPSLGFPARLDVTGLLQNIKELSLQSQDTDGTPTVDASSNEDECERKKTLEVQSPKEGDALQVYVESRLDTKGHFWVSRNLSQDIANLYENLSFRIRQDIVQSPPAQLEIEEGMLCCGQFQEDHRWYRGRVEQLKKDKGLARIRWLDYAHDNEVPLATVQPLKEEFQTLPFQALECSLFEALDEDLPHQARWEFSDHTANALLDCTILKQMSPPSSDNKCQVYLVELTNPDKEVNIKEAVMAKAEEATAKKDTIMCRDIRYMKDYVPPPSKSTKVEPAAEKAKEKVDTKEAKKVASEEKLIDANKGAAADEDKGLTREGEDEELNNDEAKDAAEKSTEASKEEVEITQRSSNEGSEMIETKKVDDGPKIEEEQKTELQGGDNNSQQDGLEGTEAGTGDGETIAPSDQIKDEANDKAMTTLAPKAAPGDVQILRRESSEPGAEHVPNGHAVSSAEQQDVGTLESQMPGNLTTQPEASGQNGVPSDKKPPGEKSKKQREKTSSAAADPGAYSLEPSDEDDEEGSDHQLIELLTRQSDRAMAHSPDNALGDRRSASSEEMPYPGGGSYHPYGGVGYHMAPGVYGGVQKPPEALGLNPVVPSVESCGSSNLTETPMPDQGSFTGDGFKINVGLSFNIYIATPLSDNGRFWASRLRGPAQESQLRRLMHDISLPSEPLALDRLKEIKVVCVQTPSGQWCRGRVEGFTDDKVQIRYVDFGQADVVEEHRIRTLPVAYQLFPYQALELSIATRHQTRFSEQAKEAFMRYTQGRILTAKVVATEPKSVYVTLTCVDENQLSYDISSAVLNINSETMPSTAEERSKEHHPGSTRRGSRDEHNEGPVSEENRPSDNYDVRYDQHYEGRSHDRGSSGDRCFVCSNYGHLSYDCPSKRGDPRERNDRRNKGGSKKNWGRKNRKY